MTQTAHAATAVSVLQLSRRSYLSLQVLISLSQILHETREREETIQYLADLRNMHKVSPPF